MLTSKAFDIIVHVTPPTLTDILVGHTLSLQLEGACVTMRAPVLNTINTNSSTTSLQLIEVISGNKRTGHYIGVLHYTP